MLKGSKLRFMVALVSASIILFMMSSAYADNSLRIGAYTLRENLRDEANVKMLEDAGIDLLLDVDANCSFLDLCQAHGIQIISTETFPGWWGGDGSNAGEYQDTFALSDVEEYASFVMNHEAVLGDYLIDEPNCIDFPWIAKIFTRYQEVLPQREPFINLHPYYDENDAIPILGALYPEYLQKYVDTIPVSYISFDSYPYSNPEVYGKTFLLGYDAVADACRKNGLEMWVTQQVGGYEAQDQLMEFQIRLQTNIALTCGAHGIIYASWSADWWDEETTCVSNDGERNPALDYVEQVNRELRNLEPQYMTYRNLCVLPLGKIEAADEYLRPQLRQLQDAAAGMEFDVCNQINADGAILCGCFENDFGEQAIMLTNVNSMFDDTADATVLLPFFANGWINGTAVNDTAELFLHPGDAAFLMIP